MSEDKDNWVIIETDRPPWLRALQLPNGCLITAYADCGNSYDGTVGVAASITFVPQVRIEDLLKAVRP